ncbi:MAG TPA: hypothetical protein VD833_05395 [Vicinamibacterales bacterium]|nr:hypothetical protein [Vicinamibacterales bacterium]
MGRPAGAAATGIALAVALTAVFLSGVVLAQGTGAPMPDARQMSGMPLPMGDMEPGTVAVRVIRGSLANPLANQRVEILGGDAPIALTTNETGRAEFKNLRIGARVKAVTAVGDERLESQEFAVPATGGIRLMLVATDPEAEKRAEEDRKLAQAPAQPGTVVLGDQSRFVFELGDEGLSVFNLLQIVNTSRTPVQPAQPVVFDLPDGAVAAGVLEGSSPQAVVAGRQVTINGPFAPGDTHVQFAYTMPYSGGSLEMAQPLPVALNQVTILLQKIGDMHVTSPQMPQHREMKTEGQTYIVGHGPALKAGDVVRLSFTGLPHAATWPRDLAIVLAVAVLGAGAWSAARSRAAVSQVDERRRKLEARRDRLFGELTALEEKHRAGGVDAARYAARRRELVSALERVYAEMDEEAAA